MTAMERLRALMEANEAAAAAKSAGEAQSAREEGRFSHATSLFDDNE